jgi:O-antigen ligase
LFWLGLLLAPFYNVLLFEIAGIELSVVDAVFLVAFALWSLSVLRRGRFRANTALGLMILFLLFSLFSSLLSVEVLVALKRWGRTLMRVLVFAVMMSDLMFYSKRRRVYVVLFVISGVLFGVLNYADFFVSPEVFLRTFFANPMRLSANLRFIYPAESITAQLGNYGHEIGHWQSATVLLTLSLLFTSSSRQKQIGWAILLLTSSTTLMFSMTKSAWLGLAVGLLYLTWRLYLSQGVRVKGSLMLVKTRLLGTALLLVGISVLVGSIFWFVILPSGTRLLINLSFTFQDASSVGRLDIWRGLVPIIGENWLMGVGWGNLVARNLSADPHNWWLGLLAETGVLGFISYAASYILMLRRIDRHAGNTDRITSILAVGANAALLSVGVEGLFEMSFMWSLTVWFCIGLALFSSQLFSSAHRVVPVVATSKTDKGVVLDS